MAFYNLKTSRLTWGLQDFDTIKKAIDKGHPIIFSVRGEGIGHILTIIGYTTDGSIVVNDSYTNLVKYGRGWKLYDTGYHSIYPVVLEKYTSSYFIEVYK